MEGVRIIDTVVNTITVTHNLALGYVVAFLISVGLLLGTAAFMYYRGHELTFIKFVILSFVAIGGLALGLSIADAFIFKEVPIGTETTYTVVVSDDVRFNEFYNKYEILDQNGSTFTVRERSSSDTTVSVTYTDNCAEDVLSC